MDCTKSVPPSMRLALKHLVLWRSAYAYQSKQNLSGMSLNGLSCLGCFVSDALHGYSFQALVRKAKTKNAVLNTSPHCWLDGLEALA